MRLLVSILLLLSSSSLMSQQSIEIPKLTSEVKIDGDLADWRDVSYSDGAWSMSRIQKSDWYHDKRNRLVVDSTEDTNVLDLKATYYIAWDENFLYLGAEVHDNVLDVVESNHEPKRWYYKDAIAWFFEVPADQVSEKFAEGDHAFCFVLDTLKPDYGAWWRHGSAVQSYMEEPIPEKMRSYEILVRPQEDGGYIYSLEARVEWKSFFTMADRSLNNVPSSMMIVHCDPDGGEYGGHMLIYGSGDDDATWTKVRFVGEE